MLVARSNEEMLVLYFLLLACSQFYMDALHPNECFPMLLAMCHSLPGMVQCLATDCTNCVAFVHLEQFLKFQTFQTVETLLADHRLMCDSISFSLILQTALHLSLCHGGVLHLESLHGTPQMPSTGVLHARDSSPPHVWRECQCYLSSIPWWREIVIVLLVLFVLFS